MMQNKMSDTNLAKLFSDGVSNIETKRCDNLFRDLDSRALTAAEEDIIAQRVALQRRMLEEYEKRERARKVKEIRAICTDLTQEEAVCALKLHKDREDDAAAALTSGTAFKRKVQAMCGRALPAAAPAQAPGARQPSGCPRGRQGMESVGAVAARPIGDFLNKIGEGIFVGTFRGRGWEHYTERMALIQRHLSPPQAQASCPAPSVGRPRTRSRDKACKPERPSAEEPQQDQGVVSPRRALAAANTSPPLQQGPGWPDQAPASHPAESPPPAPCQTHVNPAHASSGSETSNRDSTARELTPQEDVPLLSEPAAVVEEEGLPNQEQLLCGEMILEPEEAPAGPSAAAHALENESSGQIRSSNSRPGSSSQPAESVKGRDTPADDERNFLAPKEKLEGGPSASKAVSTEEEGSPSPEAPAIPKGQRGKRSSRKRAASVLWGSPTPDDSSAPAHHALSEPHIHKPAAPVTEAKLEDMLDNDEAIARALAGECEAEEGSHRRKRRQRGSGTGTPDGTAQRASSKATLPPGTGGTPRRSARAGPLPKPEVEAPAEAPKKRRGRPPRGSAANHARAAAAAAALLNKPRLGRVKRCSSKQVDVVSLGVLRLDDGWHNAGYIFPDGFTTATVFRSSVQLDQLCMHSCCIIGEGGLHWPYPTFRVLASDRPEEPLDAKSPTGAWNAALSRINAEIEARREAGEPLPPPPKTAIAGPEYFGLTHPDVILQIESLDPEHLCSKYWNGKQDRLAYGQVYGISPERKGPGAILPPRAFPAPTGGAARRRRGRISAEELAERNGEEPEEAYAGSRWSGVDRAERSRRRHGDEAPVQDDDNPCPSVIDPITLEPVVTPAISPYGHVMGLATWNAVLAEQGKCPFTQQPLRRDQIVALNKNNFERYRERIILQ